MISKAFPASTTWKNGSVFEPVMVRSTPSQIFITNKGLAVFCGKGSVTFSNQLS
ncbi:hypothetical protein [Methylomonas methanica]|uniref:hypothetical protein n=1 Tax=Methylomonas methanica TaxID=421 RepID=UPI00031DDA4D|nr:hypothetical protein [Methylomonas methanica]